MKTRCSNPAFNAYAYYGGRGIAVCPRWADSFEAFLEDMGPRPTPLHTIERDDTNGNYEKSNCRWATRREQANNKRNNHRVEIDGTVRTVAQWAEVAGLTESGFRGRLRRGLTGAALLAPSIYSN